MSQRSTVRYVFSVVVLFLSVWAIALLYWRLTGKTPGTRDLALVGIALPILVITAFAGLRTRAMPAAPGPATDSEPPAAAATPSATRDAEPVSTLSLLDSSLRVPAGRTIDDVATVARKGTLVDLHDRLKRADGSRIFAREDSTISLDGFDESLLPQGSAGKLDDEHWRALMLAGDVLDDLLSRHATAGSAKRNAADAVPPSLELHVLLPARWREIAPTLVAWIDAHVGRAGWCPSVAAAQTHIAAHPTQALAVLDELNRSLNQSRLPTRHIVLACDSWLSESAVNALDRLGELYSRDHVNGLIPGEGACALLVALQGNGESAPASCLHRITVATKHDDRTIDRLLDDARRLTGSSDIEMEGCALVSDVSQCTRQRNEITSAIAAAWPAEDGRGHRLHLGLANGESGAVLALGTVAVAAGHCLTERQPTFAVTLADPLSRAAMLVTPPPPPRSAVDSTLTA
ncbi:MAG: hypothetical protein LBJ65_20590 [Burkholderia sp.]|jgi:hypothetical protein|uniref:hypothetical protein n=1 Tax=Burkholderia sp. TaxID=36773 RepID=UPI0028218834|nr:hypothetical protein [Burkholderia sp.]MDR0244001.1 hypothetical protein [Burkholderia sp.]